MQLHHLAAVLLSLAAALSSASQNLFVRRGTVDGTAATAVFVVMLTNVAVLVPLVSVLYYPTYELTTTALFSFVAAGLLASMIGRALSYESIGRIGASRTAPIVASWSLIASVLGVVLLGESLSVSHGLGIVLVIGGIAVITWETSSTNPDDLTRKELLIGLLIPFSAAFAIGMEPVFAKIGFAEGTPALVGLAVKTVTATVGFGVFLWRRGALPDRSATESGDIRWYLLAGGANTFFILTYYLALEIAPVNVVSPLIVTSTLWVVLLSALFMPDRLERVTWKLAAAATVVVVGVLLITVHG